MANFKPLNNHALSILDKFITNYKLTPPFLDIACGNGYLSEHLAKKGWQGKAIDLSKQAIDIAKNKLKPYKNISVERKTAEKENGKYQTVLMFDLLEHIEDDQQFLKKAHSLIYPKGHLVLAVPSNPKEWRWDDEFYGHYRRYTKKELEKKLIKAGFVPILFYDYTFPFFWLLRRTYTKFINRNNKKQTREEKTEESSVVYAWDSPYVTPILGKLSFIWKLISIVQYTFFKNQTSRGNALIVLAKRP